MYVIPSARLSTVYIISVPSRCPHIPIYPEHGPSDGIVYGHRAFFFARYDSLFWKGKPLVLWSKWWYLLTMALSPANMTQ